MKSILISDINVGSESIIPYALNFTKHIDNSISIIHPVNPETHEAVSSAYADSQSFQVGNKLTLPEILKREKHNASLILDKLLSKEASKLNFPLRVSTIIEEDSLENLIKNEIRANEPSVLICTSDIEKTSLHNFGEFISLADKYDSLSLIIPPESEFAKPERVLIQLDFKSTFNTDVFKVLDYLEPLNPLIEIVDVAKNNEYIDMASKSHAWRDLANKHTSSLLDFKTSILTGEQYTETLINYIQENEFGLIAVPKETKSFLKIGNYSKYKFQDWIEQINVPFILY